MTLEQLSEQLSVIIIAFNEETNLPRCLASLPQGCEVILIDSQSIDQTAAIAQSFGAKVFQQAFTDFAQQKNFALKHATKPWVLSIDAD